MFLAVPAACSRRDSCPRAAFCVAVLALCAAWLAGCGEAAVRCGTGTVARDGVCAPVSSTVCGAGTALQGDECVAEASDPCGPGTVSHQGRCVPGDSLRCGEGTQRVGDVCVSTSTGLRCGPGTEQIGDECVSVLAEIRCGEGTRRSGDECVPRADLCDDGQAWIGGECVNASALCGAGTVLQGDRCVPVDPLAAVATVEGAENNDPAFGGAAALLSLSGETAWFKGVFEAPSDLDDDGVDDADFDAFAFAAVGGARLVVEGAAVGAPDVAFEVRGPSGYWRRALPLSDRNARRVMLLPETGDYVLRFGTASNFAGSVPQGGASFTWLGSVALESSPEPEVFDTPDFLWDAQASAAPVGHVLLPAGMPVRVTVSGGPGLGPVLLVLDGERWIEIDGGAVLFAPADGLYVAPDQRVTGTGRAVVLRAEAVGDALGPVAGGVDRALGGIGADGVDGPAWSMGISAGTVLRVDGPPGVELSLLRLGGAETVAVERIEVAVWEDAQFELVARRGVGDVTLRLRTWDVTSVGVLRASDGLVRVRTPELPEGGVLYTTLLPAHAGLATVGVRPVEGLDVDLGVFSDDVIAAGTVSASALIGAEQGPGGSEVVSDVLEGDGRLLIRIEARAGVGRPTLETRLEPVTVEVEPNDDPADATDAGALGEAPVLVTGALEDDDWYRFQLPSPGSVMALTEGPGVDAAAGAGLALYLTGDVEDPVAQRGSSEQAPFAQLEVILPAGDHLLRVTTPDGAPTGRYVVRLRLVRAFACLPSSELCLDDRLGVCTEDGAGFDAIDCAVSSPCVPVDGTPACGSRRDEEPNDTLGRAQPLGALGVGRTGVRGALVPESDVDFLGFALPDGGVVDVGTLPLGREDADTQITLYGPRGALADDDDSGPMRHARVGPVPLPAGAYTVAIATLSGPTEYRAFFDVQPLACVVGLRRCAGDVLEACDGLGFSTVEVCELGCVPGDPAACALPPPPQETEPNDIPDEAFVAVPLPQTVGGRIDPDDDVDWYRFSTVVSGLLQVGTQDPGAGDPVNTRIVLCSATQAQNGCSWVGPRTARNDDAEGRGLYSYLELQVPAGEWFVAVESFGPDTGDYLVTMGLGPFPGEPDDDWRQAGDLGFGVARFAIDAPGDVDWYAVTLGEAARLRFETRSRGTGRDVDTRLFVCDGFDPDGCAFLDPGSNLGSNDDADGLDRYSRVDVEFPGGGVYYVVVEAFGDQSGDYDLRITDVFEPNDGAASPAPLEVPSRVHAVLDADEDWYETLVVFVGETHTFTTSAWSGQGAVDTRLRLVRLDDPETVLIENDDGEGLGVFSRVRYTFDRPGEYAVVVSGPDGPIRGGYVLRAEAEF